VADPPCIYVLAGTNGAGKSSVAGAAFRAAGADYFNPDEAARRILSTNPVAGPDDANSAAWHHGRRLLERAIAERLTFAFETTLAGDTITALLGEALSARIEVRVWYVGLDTVARHIARVKSRAARGGHDIPVQKIRERYDRSRVNLLRLLPRLAELRVYDNSRESDPAEGLPPQPILLLHMVEGRIVRTCDLAATPEWAKPILMAAMTLPE
jgi:predicted ABC-type ATPase